MKMDTDSLKRRIDGILLSMKDNLPALEREIDEMIKSSCRDEQKIEGILDILLDYHSLGMGRKEFNRLNSYYWRVNPKNSKVYSGFYQDILSDSE